MSDHFKLQSTSQSARAGVLSTRRGDIETPFFMSVATRGAIKGAVSADDLVDCQAPVMLCNTYHLHLRPGADLVAEQGGLHDFTHWKGPILTDSGGFQVFSIKQKKITDDGVWFRSHINGDKFFLDAETSIDIQHKLGADMIMAFDECPPNVPNWHKIRKAVDKTTAWAERSLRFHQSKFPSNLPPTERPQLFGIIQGGSFSDLRQRSLDAITALDFDGFALGGLAVGETHEQMYKVLDEMAPQLPTQKPRYLMGVGTPENLLEAISRGIDMFDCVFPSRNARHGTVYTWDGPIRISNAEFRHDRRPLDPTSESPVKHSRSYLHHLFRVGEDLAKRYLTMHNLAFYHELMRRSRQHIIAGDFESWKAETLARWQ